MYFHDSCASTVGLRTQRGPRYPLAFTCVLTALQCTGTWVYIFLSLDLRILIVSFPAIPSAGAQALNNGIQNGNGTNSA